MTDEVERITLHGVDLGFCAHGGDVDKPPLVFIHGYAMRSTAGPYEELVKQLAREYAVYALDLRGHGASASAVSEWSWGALADDVVGFARALELDRPAVVGHSLGAVLALYAELRHPGTFSAICLVTPGPADPRDDSVQGLQLLIEHGQDRPRLREGFRQMFVRPPGEMLELTLDAVALIDPEVHRAQAAQNASFSIDDELGNVSAPTLLLCGERDNVIPPARQHDMARKLHRCTEVVFPDEGHLLPNESPTLAAREILAFLARQRASAVPEPTDADRT